MADRKQTPSAVRNYVQRSVPRRRPIPSRRRRIVRAESGPDGKVGLPAVEESFESEVEAALGVVGRVGKLGITNDAGEEGMAPALDDLVE